jgi:hypothetical protein
MSSDQIQPERDLYARRKPSATAISGRAWVKRDLEFWHRCNIDFYGKDGVLVTLDNMDELTVPHDHVQQVVLEPGDLVFVQRWEGGIGAFPAVVVAAKGEAVEVKFPGFLYGKDERRMCLLREVRFYGDLAPTILKKGTRVFAYKAVQWYPPIFLMFPATVEAIHFDVCVEVEFGDGGRDHVPITLVDKVDLAPGDIVHTCTSYMGEGMRPELLRRGTTATEIWEPCRILERAGDNLHLQDGAGDQFQAPIAMVAILPKGYRMPDGKFEKIPNEPTGEPARSALDPARTYDVHIVRTVSWMNAADDPITKVHLDGLMDADPELAWSPDAWASLNEDAEKNDRYFSILWKGQPCFWWYRNEIRCAGPGDQQLAKMVDIAIALDANVIGDDGREYH